MKKNLADNERGFVTVMSLALFPLIVTVIAVVYAGFLIMKNQSETLHICRVDLLRSQEKVASDLKNLVSLNSSAEALRTQLKEAQLALETSTTPAQAAAAEAAIEIIEAQQAILALKQRALIVQAKTESRLAPQRTFQAINEALQTSQKFQSDGSTSYAYPFSIRSASFEVVANPEDSETPNYNPSPDFSEKQTMKVGTQIAIERLLPKWLGLIVKPSGLQMKAVCAATLEQGEDTWNPTLKAVKSSLN